MNRILLIEDNHDVRENTAELLELSDYEVVTAPNGKEGVKKALEEDFDLIVCDVMMPELDGYGVLRILSKKPKTNLVPFIFLTAKSDKEDFRKGMQLGADDYLTKPFDGGELIDAIELRLKKSALLNNAFDASKENGGLHHVIDEARGLRELTSLSEEREERHFRKKDTIFFEGQTPRHVFQIIEGKVKIHRTNDEGRELIVSLFGPGEFFGYLSVLRDTDYKESAIALSDTVVNMIPKEDFYKLIYNDRDVGGRFLKYIAGNLLKTEEHLLDLAYNSVRKRVADALVLLKERYDREGSERFTIAILRDDLAQMVGTAKETVIRMLSDFKDEGLIEVKGSKITIVDEEALKDMWQ